MAYTEFDNRLSRIRGTYPTVELPPEIRRALEARAAGPKQKRVQGFSRYARPLAIAYFAGLILAGLPTALMALG